MQSCGFVLGLFQGVHRDGSKGEIEGRVLRQLTSGGGNASGKGRMGGNEIGWD